MAPDRGQHEHNEGHDVSLDENDQLILESHLDENSEDDIEDDPTSDEAGQLELSLTRSELGKYCDDDEQPPGRSFTIRSLIVGLLVGILICFSNTFFGLQSGWISGMTMPASLIGFAFFKTISRHLSFPFSPVENVLVQTVATSVGTMPLGSGFVGVIPALEYLLTPAENGPLKLSLGKLIIWSLGLSFFGVVFGVPLRKQVILKEELKFPSGTATALMIGVLHGGADGEKKKKKVKDDVRTRSGSVRIAEDEHGESTLMAYFIPQLRHIPFLGRNLAINWLWTFNMSPAYAAQGIIMGPATTSHMLLGAIVGWGILSPLAKYQGWAPGPVKDWDRGSKGWIVWISLAIMLSDSVISLGWLIGRPIFRLIQARLNIIQEHFKKQGSLLLALPKIWIKKDNNYTSSSQSEVEESTALMLNQSHTSPTNNNTTRKRQPTSLSSSKHHQDPLTIIDAPPDQQISNRTVLIGLLLSSLLLIMALLLSIMGVRALGETDLNPVSGISKLTQLLFAIIIPRSNPNSVLINLVVGAISEAGALQAGDMLQDLKTGHLLAASPKAQFQGQMIGSFVGAVTSAVVYRLYTSVYEVPGDLFQVPTGYVWIFTARLVTGRGLPQMAGLGQRGGSGGGGYRVGLQSLLVR
ncbi:MAG: hypothetical protein M1823_003660 [Watsoniomyces obsoletus]|nr:MAG: hypothetical protein M1823_003660 [Watsoniomyces obsoletus]